MSVSTWAAIALITDGGAVIKQMAAHPLTDKGLEAFMKDWEKTGQKIL